MTPPFDTTFITPQVTPPPIPSPHTYPTRELSKGDILYYFGDEAEAVYRVEEGLLKLGLDLSSGRERIFSVAGPGDFIGAVTPLPTYQETAEGLSAQVRLTVIPLDQLEDVQAQLHVATGVQLSRLREALTDGDLPVNARLANTLLRLGERFGQVSGRNVRLTLPLTQDNLAAMVGAARETTTAVLSEMRNQGVIQGTRGHYSFDSGELTEFATDASF